MQRTVGDRWYGLYEYPLPEGHAAHHYEVYAINNAGDASPFAELNTSDSRNLRGLQDLELYNSISHGGINLNIHFDIDSKNLTAMTAIKMDGLYPTRNITDFGSKRTDYVTGLNTQGSQCDYTECFFQLPITLNHPDPSYPFVDFNSSMVKVNKMPLKLFGDSLRFPFDDYYVNLVFAVPLNNLTVRSITPSFSTLLNGSWYPGHIQNSSIDAKKIGFPQYELIGKQYLFPIVASDLNPNLVSGNTSFFNVNIHFYRANSIISIVLPLLSIFYLLGAILILENKTEQVAIRIL